MQGNSSIEIVLFNIPFTVHRLRSNQQGSKNTIFQISYHINPSLINIIDLQMNILFLYQLTEYKLVINL